MLLDFTAIDFETANRHRGSACSVGVVRVRGSIIVDARHRLMRPPAALDFFEDRNIDIHGITSAMVADKHSFAESFDTMMGYLGDDVLVGHNVCFDMQVLQRACEADGIEPPDVRAVCTRDTARELLDLSAYRLPDVAAALGISLDHHHDALADALAAAEIMIALARLPGFTSCHAFRPLAMAGALGPERAA